jgi:sigma-B regulation protein RsbU (phosphoserine phosphatase)
MTRVQPVHDEGLLRASFDAQPDPHMIIEAARDGAGRIVDFIYRDVNHAACESLGVFRERLIGRGMCETATEFAESELLSRYAECLEAGTPVIMDNFTFTTVGGGPPRQCDIRGARVSRDVLTITWRDVTERFDLLRRITESEAQLRLLTQNIGEVVLRIGDDGTVLSVAGSVEHALGVRATDYLGRHVDDIVVPSEGGPSRWQAARDGEAVVGRTRIVIGGEVHWIMYFLKPFYDADGVRDGLVATFRVADAEVAVERQVEEARRLQAEADARWRRMIDNAAVGMCLSMMSGRFDVVNQAMCDFFGYDEKTLLQMTWQELTAPEFLEPNLANTEMLLSGRVDSYRMAKQFIHADGHLVWGDMSVSCLRRPDGEVERLIAQIIDITKEVEARRNLTNREQQNRVLAKRLQAQSDLLTAELRSAAQYVASILPTGLDGLVRVSSRYLSSQALAGDCFDYRWIDDDHLIVYLLDVSGHGIQSALLSVSIHNLLRSGSLSGSDLMQPDHVLTELNELFAMEKHADNYFTMWFGVYEASTRTLRYCSGGHPAALLLSADSDPVTELSTGGMPVGMFDNSEYASAAAYVNPGDALLIYSDGAYELPTPEGQTWSLTDFVALCRQRAARRGWTLDSLIEDLRRRSATGAFDDDLSLVRLDFPD